MRTRVLVAVPITIVVLLAIFVQGWILAAFAVFVGLMATWELMRAMDKALQPVIMAVALLFAALFVLDFWHLGHQEWSVAFLSADLAIEILVLAVIASFLYVFFDQKKDFGALKNTLFALCYPQLFSLFFYLLILRVQTGSGVSPFDETLAALLILFVPPMLSDTLAYLWGRKFGRRKLCPAISPNKTVAGSVAGIAGGGAGGALVFGLLQALHAFPMFGILAFIAMGALLAFLSQFGDLAASYIKRAVGIKDFGKLLPGHGGILDRFDSTLFIIPIVYLFARAGILSVT